MEQILQTNATVLSAKKMLDQVREIIRYRHYSLSMEKTYISWINTISTNRVGAANVDYKTEIYPIHR